MVISNDDELTALKDIGRIVANTLEAMGRALEPGITTFELDQIGLKLLQQEGAESAPETVYRFPGATCISVNEEVAHGIPGPRIIQAGDLVNIDVSAVKNGFFADNGATFTIPPVDKSTERLCRDGRRALWTGLRQVETGKPFSAIGEAIGAFAAKSRYTLIRNLASHGVGRSLHEDPKEISTWPDSAQTEIMQEGHVFTIEPFLSLGAVRADNAGNGDRWTLLSHPKALTVQYEHTVVATRHGPLILTLPG